MSGGTEPGGGGAGSGPLRTLDAVRTGDRGRRWLVTAGAVAAGLLAVTVHWAGLVVGGAVVGLLQRDLGRAVVAGLVFGVVVLVAFVLVAPRLEAGELLALTPAVYVTIGASLGLSLLGSLARGIL